MIYHIEPIRHNSGYYTYNRLVSNLSIFLKDLSHKSDVIIPEDTIREVINRSIIAIYHQLYEGLKFQYASVLYGNFENAIMEYGTVLDCIIKLDDKMHSFGNIKIMENEDPLYNHISEVFGLTIVDIATGINVNQEILYNVANGYNSMYDQSLLYYTEDNRLMVYIGNKIRQAVADKQHIVAEDKPFLRISVIRKPILDDLKQIYPKSDYNYVSSDYFYPDKLSPYSETFYKMIDMDDRYIRLIEMSAKKELYDLTGNQAPESLDNTIVSIINQIMGQKNATVESNS